MHRNFGLCPDLGVGGKKQNLRKSLIFRGFLRFDKFYRDPLGVFTVAVYIFDL